MDNLTDRRWKLGEDLNENDNLLDGITFEELITTVHCNCRKITEKSVIAELDRILEIRHTDMEFLVRENMSAIIAAAKKGRE